MGNLRQAQTPRSQHCNFTGIGSCRNGKRNIHLQQKYAEIEEKEVRYEEIHCDDAEYLIVAFGSCARIAQKAMEEARAEGIKVGLLRPITLWPFPSKAIAERSRQVKGILTVELNAGQWWKMFVWQ